MLVIDGDALKENTPADDEIQRVLRPDGTALVKRNGQWETIRGQWPDTIADLTHWLGDSRLSSQVPDAEIGRVRSLRWHTGRKELAGGQVWAAGGVAVAEIKLDGQFGLVGFDAFTGLQLWHRADVRVAHNYQLTLDRQRIVLRPRDPDDDRRKRRGDTESKPSYFRSFDLFTGKDLLTYTEGPNVAGDDHVLCNLHDGKLVIAATGSLTVLDAATGARLWQVEHPRRHVMFPSIDNGRLACVFGAESRATQAHGASLDREVDFDEAVCYELSSGRELWRWTQDKLPQAATTYAAFSDDRYWVSLMPPQGAKGKNNTWYLACLDPATGKPEWIADHPAVHVRRSGAARTRGRYVPRPESP